MKKLIFTSFCVVVCALFSTTSSKAQCSAGFNVYPDTTIGAPLHTYLGNNTSQPANFIGVDTINYTYTWSWGDGTSTTAPYPSHTYANTGNYTITLLMNSNPIGGPCQDTFTMTASILKTEAMAYITIINPTAIPTSTRNITENKMSIFPNPVADQLFINGLAKDNYSLAIFSLEGKLLATPALDNNGSVNVGELAKGNYILKVTASNNKSNVLKFFKD